MERTITVRGHGTVTAAPDRIEITLRLESRDMDYSAASAQADIRIGDLTQSVTRAGFSADDLKTTSYHIQPEYESVCGPDGVYRQERKGYLCEHTLLLAFDYDRRRLDDVVTALASCPAVPGFDIRFTVRDPEALRDRLLNEAAAHARSRAETLCAASGVRLGTLLRIEYDRGDRPLYSDTSCTMAFGGAMLRAAKAADIAPEDIRLDDTAVFVWAIE